MMDSKQIAFGGDDANTTLPAGKGDDRPSIAVLMPMVWGARNVVHSGVLRRLAEAGVDVYLLMRDVDPTLLDDPQYDGFTLATSVQALVRPPTRRRIKGRSFLRRVIQSAFSRRHQIGSYPIYRRWFERHYTTGQRLRTGVIELLGRLAQPSPLFYRLYALYNTLYRLEYDLGPARRQLQGLAPDLVWSTVNVDATFERVYALAARDLGIPLVNSILSFDNLTSKPAHLVYDHYLVWSERMASELLRFYPQVGRDQVSITGTPQFDFHCRPDYRWSRKDTLACLGLPGDSRYFLYTCGNQSLTPAEPELVGRLARRMKADPVLQDDWLVVRTHPLDDWSRWDKVRGSTDRLLLSQAWQVVPDQEGWSIPPREDQARFVSSMLHAEACLNIASTTTLDAAILDRPVIGIRFEHEADAPREIMYDEYDVDHYRPLVESGGLRVARTWSELLALMREAIEHPGRDREARRRMVAQECGMVDGRAAERVSDDLLNRLATIRKR